MLLATPKSPYMKESITKLKSNNEIEALIDIKTLKDYSLMSYLANFTKTSGPVSMLLVALTWSWMGPEQKKGYDF